MWRAGATLGCGERGLLLVVVRRLLIAVAFLVAERRLSSCGARAWLLRGMWDFSDQGSNPCSLHWQPDS